MSWIYLAPDRIQKFGAEFLELLSICQPFK
jgi:hypothetical protein